MGPVLLNGRAAARPELGGPERVARELCARLPALRPGAYAVATPPPALVHRAGHAWEQLVLPRRAARARALLSPAGTGPVVARRHVLVLFDAAALRHPEGYSRAYVAWQRAVLPRLAARALHVVTVSEFSRDELCSLLPLDAARTSVVALGVDGRFRPGAPGGPAMPRPYVLTVGSATARKGLAALGPAAQALAARGIDLLAAGGDRPQFRGEQVAGVRRLGRVPEAQLAGLYAGAEAFVLPSLHEGFGLTALEAMASGVPVVASDRGALPETCGDGARLVDPGDGDALTDAILAAIGDEALAARGRARAARFTWERTAREVDAVLSAVAG